MSSELLRRHPLFSGLSDTELEQLLHRSTTLELKAGDVLLREGGHGQALFVILEGRGEVLVGERWNPVRKGDVAFVPRWIFHQTRNTSATEELVFLAITDFGFTSAVLGDYDKRTRLGGDVQAESA